MNDFITYSKKTTVEIKTTKIIQRFASMSIPYENNRDSHERCGKSKGQGFDSFSHQLSEID